MSHLIYIDDPWFGPYFKVTCPTFAQSSPTITVGPLFDRTMRIESLDQSGERVTAKGETKFPRGGRKVLKLFVEKQVTHGFVEGFVYGEQPEMPYYFGTFYGSPHGSAYTHSKVMVNGQGQNRLFKVSYDLFRDEQLDRKTGSGSCTFVFRMEYYGENMQTGEPYTQTYKFSVFCTLKTDPQNGSITYGPLSIISRDGPGSESVTIQDCACPYGQSFDHLGGQLDAIRHYVDECRDGLDGLRDDKTVRDIAIYDAIENVSLWCINPLETIPELLEPLASIRQLAEFFRGGFGFDDILRKIANFHLFWKYVVLTGLLTADAFRKMYKFFTGNFGNVAAAIMNTAMIGRGSGNKSYTTKRGDDVHVRYNAKVCYRPDSSSFNTVMNRLAALGFLPKLIDLWDIVPYSFVLDWCIPIADLLQHIDDTNNVSTLPLSYLLLSKRVRYAVHREFAVNNHKFRVEFTYGLYERKILHSLPSDLWLGCTFRDPRKRWITALALIVQRVIPS